MSIIPHNFNRTVVGISTIPNPAENDYDKCLYALFVELDSILSDMSKTKKLSNEIVIVVPIMKDKSIIKDNIFKLGDKVFCEGVEYDSMPEEIKEIQLSDDIQSYENQQLYILRIKGISTFSGKGNKDFAKKEKTFLPIQTLPRDERASVIRRERINKEIARIESELEKHGGSFEEWKREYTSISEKYKEMRNQKWKGWINDSYYSVGGQISAYDTEEYIKSMLPYKVFLEKNNIDLIIVRIPAKDDFASAVLASEDFQDNPLWIEHYYKCLKADLEIVDPMPFMWEHKYDFPLFYYYNDPSEQHPYEGAYFCISQVLSNILTRYHIPPNTDNFTLKRVSHSGKDRKFFFPSGNPKYPSQDNITYNQVIYRDKPMSNLQRMSGSPFLFVSNSFFGYYLANDLALPYYVAYQLKTIPDWLYQDGDTKLLRNAINNPDLLASRKAVILVGMPGMWGTQPIPSLPKYLLDGVKKIYFEKEVKVMSHSIKIFDNEQYLTEDTANGLEFKKKEKRSFSFLITVPYIQNQTICMLKFVYSLNTSSNVYALDPKDDSIIDFDFFRGTELVNSLFIPVNKSDRLVKIKVEPWYDSPFVLNRLEFWYY